MFNLSASVIKNLLFWLVWGFSKISYFLVFSRVTQESHVVESDCSSRDRE